MNKDGFISTFYSLLYHYCFLVTSVLETLGLHVLGKAPVGFSNDALCDLQF